MSPRGLLESNVSGAVQAGRPDDVHRLLEGLRARLDESTSDNTVDDLLVRLMEGTERLSLEHAGLADELLATYEQLGVVFEVTRKLPELQGESEVIDLFVDSLRMSYPKQDVFFVHASAGCSDILQDGLLNRTCPAPVGRSNTCPAAWIDSLIQRAHDRKSVTVESAPSPDGGEGAAAERVAEALVGPVLAGPLPGGFAGSIVLTRSENVAPFRAGDMLLLESLTMFCGHLVRTHRLVNELREMSTAVVRSLVNAVDQKDPYTSGHSLRVGYFATLLAQTLDVGSRDLQMLQWSALLHDVGKIGIRDEVLHKRGGLTDEEFRHIKEHPVRSHKVVQDVPQLAGALDGVLHHHEHYDGTGYPAGLAGEEIPLQARIIQIADVFDALTSDRSYRPGYNWPKALEILKEEAGRAVDPRLLITFDQLIRKTLEGDPDGWEKMVQRADLFTPSRGTSLND